MRLATQILRHKFQRKQLVAVVRAQVDLEYQPNQFGELTHLHLLRRVPSNDSLYAIHQR